MADFVRVAETARVRPDEERGLPNHFVEGAEGTLGQSFPYVTDGQVLVRETIVEHDTLIIRKGPDVVAQAAPVR